jgi:CheY-like chemotaxis protein
LEILRRFSQQGYAAHAGGLDGFSICQCVKANPDARGTKIFAQRIAGPRTVLVCTLDLLRNLSMPNKIIMLVEDNPDDEALTLRALKKNNIQNEVVVAHDGVEALDYLLVTGVYANRDPSLKPVVILLDLKLPKVDGLEVLRRLRAEDRTKFIPVVVLTSSKEEQDLIHSYSFGCNSYIRKPVDFVQFVEAVRQLGLYWLVLNEPPPE